MRVAQAGLRRRGGDGRRRGRREVVELVQHDAVQLVRVCRAVFLEGQVDPLDERKVQVGMVAEHRRRSH